MKKFDLLAKKRELDERRVKDTRETIGTRITKVLVGLIGAFMLWSAFSTVNMPAIAHTLINLIIVACLVVYYVRAGIFKKNDEA